jgi:GT2 family glycosyltransferase
MARPLVSVVVPCYRPGPLIDGCVERLLAQDLDAPHEVIVVESSGDGTAERLRTRFPACRVIAPAARTLPAEAQNIGVAAASGRFVAITNHDCLVQDDWLRRLVARHQRGSYAAVGGAVANGTPESRIGTAAYWSEFNEFTPGRPAGEVRGVPQCNVCFRRDALVGATPFPTVRFGAEELTFNYELGRAGGVFFFDPSVVVTHLNRTTWEAFTAHQRLLGMGSAMARRLVPLPGGQLVRHPTLIALMPLYRTATLLGRALRAEPAEMPRVLALTPLMFAGYVAWARGFRQGTREPLDARTPAA